MRDPANTHSMLAGPPGALFGSVGASARQIPHDFIGDKTDLNKSANPTGVFCNYLPPCRNLTGLRPRPFLSRPHVHNVRHVVSVLVADDQHVRCEDGCRTKILTEKSCQMLS